MTDRPVSATAVVAALLWSAAVALVAGDVFFGIERLGRVGLLAGMGAVTVTTRRIAYTALDALEQRERNAFELGRDAAEVRRLR